MSGGLLAGVRLVLMTLDTSDRSRSFGFCLLLGSGLFLHYSCPPPPIVNWLGNAENAVSRISASQTFLMVLINVSKLGEKGYKTYKKHVCGNARFRFGKCLPCPQMFGCRALEY